MKRRPSTDPEQRVKPGALHEPLRPERPEDLGDAIEPFLCSGGASAFFFSSVPTFDPRGDGVQLLAAQWVPEGRTAWIKQIRVAPYCPPELAAPWQGWPGTWQDFQPVGPVDNVRAPAQGGVYTTPMGWESYFDLGTEVLPQWEWWLATIPGTLAAARANAGAGAFSLADPSSWYLALNTPVPASAYAGGFPGSAITGFIAPQRMQVLQGDAINWHVNVPEKKTILLFAKWSQSAMVPPARNAAGSMIVGPSIYPLLPSFGQMVGYLQAASTGTAQQNARYGWGG
jgi:hypothetical protein